MQITRFRAFLLSILLALIACGPPAPTGTQSPVGGQTASGAQGAKGGADTDKNLAPPEAVAQTGAPGDEGEGSIGRGFGGALGDGAAAPPEARKIGAGGPGGAGEKGFRNSDLPDVEAPRPAVPINAQDPVPVTAADPSSGKKTALVTLVEFSDFQCPFCRMAARTVADLQRIYGDKLRVVWKNTPLPFHKLARPAAEAAMAAFESRGDAAFWAYHDHVFASRQDEASFADALKMTSLTQQDVDRARQRGAITKKINADIDLGKSIGVTGTPAFFINGVMLSGAQPLEKFQSIIDAEIARSKELLASGVAPEALYVKATVKNFVAPTARPSASPPEEDKTTYLVPVGKSPVRGKATALVTIVEFSDFQCPFCARVAPTIEQILAKYGDKVRLVWKNNPLPFHPRAEPAAEFALEARAQKGDAGFWKAYEQLFAAGAKLDDADIEAMAAAAGLKTKPVMDAIAKHKYKAEISADQDLADDLAANGTPHFFINGRRLVGAQPLETFTALIDAELVIASALVAKGTPPEKVYETIQKDAKPPAPPEKKSVPAPGKESPSKGPANAKVVVQIFSDFQCPFCKRSEATIAEVMGAYPGKVRFVWRNLPLPFHPYAAPAAEAAMEARAQKGDAAFWKMHDRFFTDQSEAGIGREALEKHASEIGLDLGKFKAALDSGAHKAEIEADKKIADAAGISGTPAFVINGYFISGAQPFSKFKKIIDRALAEAK